MRVFFITRASGLDTGRTDCGVYGLEMRISARASRYAREADRGALRRRIYVTSSSSIEPMLWHRPHARFTCHRAHDIAGRGRRMDAPLEEAGRAAQRWFFEFCVPSRVAVDAAAFFSAEILGPKANEPNLFKT